MGEVIAKGALYYGAVSPKRTLVSSERYHEAGGDLMIIVGPSMAG
jgi:hypothetical protein